MVLLFVLVLKNKQEGILRTAPIVRLVEPSFRMKSEAMYLERKETINPCTRITGVSVQNKEEGSIVVIVHATVSTLSMTC